MAGRVGTLHARSLPCEAGKPLANGHQFTGKDKARELLIKEGRPGRKRARLFVQASNFEGKRLKQAAEEYADGRFSHPDCLKACTSHS